MLGVRADAKGTLPKFCRIAVPAAALICGACAQEGSELPALPLAEPVTTSALPDVTPPAAAPPSPSASGELTVSNATATAIRKAREMRQKGQKSEALASLDKLPEAESNPALLSERGLLALELGETRKAESLLRQALSKGNEEWHLHSALGAALSANGRQQEAQIELAKALALAPDHPAILNNLALSYALDGKHAEAERLLRHAADKSKSPLAGQNLALILGLKGNVDEARKVAESVLPPESAAANLAYFQRLKPGADTLSRIETIDRNSPAFRSASAAIGTDDSAPIMRLGTQE